MRPLGELDFIPRLCSSPSTSLLMANNLLFNVQYMKLGRDALNSIRFVNLTINILQFLQKLVVNIVVIFLTAFLANMLFPVE